MHEALRLKLGQSGAAFDPGTGRPLHFGDPAGELDAALGRCALVEASLRVRMNAAGRDILDFLHRLSTQDLKSLPAGEGRPTVLTTSKGRIVARVFVHSLGPGNVRLGAGRGTAERILDHFKRFTLAEDLGLQDVSASTVEMTILGPAAEEAAIAAGLPVLAPFAPAEASFQGAKAEIFHRDGYNGRGYSVVVVPAEGAPQVWETLAAAVARLGGRPVGDLAAEAWRVLRGYPSSGRELTEEHNPLEAGLLDAVSFTKGCYIGQEVVARLKTYDKVSRSLVGLVLPEGCDLPHLGSAIRLGNREIGKVTSALLPPGRRAPVGLGYVKLDGLEAARFEVTTPSGIRVAQRAWLPFGPTP